MEKAKFTLVMEIEVTYENGEGVSTYTRIAPVVTNYGMYVATDNGSITECNVKEFKRIIEEENNNG